MKDDKLDSFIQLLYQTHKAEWEATPKIRACVGWLSDLFEFLFPNNHANKLSIYGGHLKKNQIDLENILLSYLDPKDLDIEGAVIAFYDSLNEIYQNLRHDLRKRSGGYQCA